MRAVAAHNTMTWRAFARSLRNSAARHTPIMRARISGGAALAGWHNGRTGWWRHGNGGYGWVGPLFWPFAFYDIYDYAFWGYGAWAPFWGYGYHDIYPGMCAPYRDIPLACDLPPPCSPV